MKVLRGLFKILSAVIYIIIIFCIAIIVPVIAGYRPVTVLSNSMYPTYKQNGVIYYKSTPFENIQIGDAITFQLSEGELCTHRVVEKDDQAQTFITKGDNNNTNDTEPIVYSRVMGKASDVFIPYIGWVIQQILKIEVIAVLIGILLINLLINYDNDNASKKEKSVSRGVSFADSTPKKVIVEKPQKPQKKQKAKTAKEYFKDL